MRRILALDFGLKRIGAAIGDIESSIASPMEVYARRDERLDALHYQDLARSEQVERIVVGLPVHTSGQESEISRAARRWGAWLARETGVPVVFFDERYTSLEAESLLSEAGLTKKRRKSKRDSLAAQILLRDYLDAGCPADERPSLPIEDDHR